MAVSIGWQAAATVEPLPVNQVMAQIGVPAPNGVPDGVYLALGRILPPVIASPDFEAQQKDLESLQGSTMEVTVQGRFLLSRAHLDALIQVLQDTAAQYDAAVHQAQGHVSRPGNVQGNR